MTPEMKNYIDAWLQRANNDLPELSEIQYCYESTIHIKKMVIERIQFD